MIIFLGASGERKFSGIFGISRSEDQSMLWCTLLDKQGDQLAGAISRKNKFCRNLTVCSNRISEADIISVRIRRKQIYIFCNFFFDRSRKTKWIDVCSEFNDIFFIQMIVSANFFYITSVKNHFSSHWYTLLFSLFTIIKHGSNFYNRQPTGMCYTKEHECLKQSRR